MNVRLRSVRFRMPESPENGAFPLSVAVQGGREILTGPEWRAGAGSSALPAAFAPGAPFLEAEFDTDSSDDDNAVIGASAQPGSLLGDVEPTPVRFINGRWTGRMNLSQTGMGSVRHGQVHWNWHVSNGRVEPDLSEHEIYTVIGPPFEPWNTSGNSALTAPWIEALDVACAWARGAETASDVLTAVAATLYGLGERRPPAFLYGCNIYAESKTFHLPKFLQALEHVGNPIDCADCATVVSTLANLLGCTSWQMVLNTPNGIPFITNPLRSIGNTNLETFRFNQHEIAWEENLGRVWDACFGLNGLTFEAAKSVAFSPVTAEGLELYSRIRRKISM